MSLRSPQLHARERQEPQHGTGGSWSYAIGVLFIVAGVGMIPGGPLPATGNSSTDFWIWVGEIAVPILIGLSFFIPAIRRVTGVLLMTFGLGMIGEGPIAAFADPVLNSRLWLASIIIPLICGVAMMLPDLRRPRSE